MTFRKYRSDADPSPFMGAIRNMSFHADALTRNRNTIQKMSRRTPDGEVFLMRVGGIDYIDIVPTGVAQIYYLVRYRNKDGIEHIKLLNIDKKEITDFVYETSSATWNKFSFGSECKVGNLIFTQTKSNVISFYDITTGQFLEDYCPKVVGYQFASGVVVENNILYLSGSFGLIKIIVNIESDGTYQFDESTISTNYILCENKVFFYQKVIYDSNNNIPLYWIVSVIDKDSGAETDKIGWNHTTPTGFTTKNWSTPTYYQERTYGTDTVSSIFTWSYGIETASYAVISTPPTINITGTELVDAATMFFTWDKVFYNLTKNHYDGTGNQYQNVERALYDYNGYAVVPRKIELSPNYYAYYASQGVYSQWIGFDESFFYIKIYFTSIGGAIPFKDYYEWNNTEITLNELCDLFTLPSDLQNIVSITYIPGLEKNPEVAALLR